MVTCVIDPYHFEHCNNLYQEDRLDILKELGHCGTNPSASGPSARTSVTEERANSFLVSLLRSALSVGGGG